MKKRFVLEDLCCANCAAKMETAINKIDGVQSATINFMAQKLSVEADDERFESIMDEIVAGCRKSEPDCTIKR